MCVCGYLCGTGRIPFYEGTDRSISLELFKVYGCLVGCWELNLLVEAGLIGLTKGDSLFAG